MGILFCLFLITQENLEERLHRLRQKIETTRQEEKRLRTKERNILKELEKIDKEIERSRKRLRELTRREKKLNKELDRLLKTEERLTHELEVTRNDIKTNVHLLYSQDEIYTDEYNELALFLLQTELDRYRKIKAKRDSVLRASQLSERKLKEIIATKKAIEAEKKRIETKRKQKSRLLSKIKKKRKETKKMMDELISSRNELEKLIAEKVTRRAKGALRAMWPCHGTIARKYGMIYNEEYGVKLINKGIDISAPYGTPVVACASGKVVYTGIFLGYGKIILIDHENGYHSLYAHLADILVEQNQRVEKGEIIGRVGNTGAASKPVLHFEIRKNGAACNPLEYLE